MATDAERLVTAQWVFERQLAWIAAADLKVAGIVALNTALLGGLATAFSAASSDARTSWAHFATLAAAATCALAIFCASMAMHPRTRGPLGSLLFFSRVASTSLTTYQAELSAASDADLLADWAAQIHRNAQIAQDKYWWVARGMGWSFAGALPWIAAIGLLVKF